jgi:hypothetical protein
MSQRELEAKAQTSTTVHRQSAEERDEEEASPIRRLQRQYGNRAVGQMLERKGEGGTEVAPEVEEAIQQARGGGQALDSGVRDQMEPALGADFGGVRVHTGGEADALNRELNARAFTTGQDVFFRQGEYSPGSSGGRELLAHELTHVVQQTGRQGQNRSQFHQASDGYERKSAQTTMAAIRRQQQPTTQESQQTASPLVTFTGANFMGSLVRCDVQFVDALQRVDTYAGNRGIQVVVTNSFRLVGQVVTDQVVPAVNLGNHHAGHAIDMNMRYQGQPYNSVALAPSNLSNLPQAVQDFISDIRSDNALRWGGDFTPSDPVHIDDGLNLNNPTLFQQRVQAVQAAAQQPQQPAVQPTQQPTTGQGASVQRQSVRPKLTVGQPDDRYEQEADWMARAVAHRKMDERTNRSLISQPTAKNQQRTSLRTETALLLQPAQAQTKQAGIKIVKVRGAYLYFSRPITKAQAFEFLFGPLKQKSTPELVDVWNNWERLGDDPSDCYYFAPKAVIPKTQGGTGIRYTTPMEVFALAYAKTMTKGAKGDIQELGKVPTVPQPFVVRAEPEGIKAAREKEKPFKDKNKDDLGENGIERVFQALAAVVGDNIHLWGEFYDHYSKKYLRKVPHKSLQSKPDEEVWAETVYGNTKVSDKLFSEDQHKFLGQILMHELAHTHHLEGMGRVMEPEALAVEYFFGQRAGGPTERLDNIKETVIAQGAFWKALFRNVYGTLQVLHDPRAALQKEPHLELRGLLTELDADEARQMVALMVTEGTRLTVVEKKKAKNGAARKLIAIWNWIVKNWQDLDLPL